MFENSTRKTHSKERVCLCPPKPCEGGLNLITASIKSIWQIFQGTAQAQKSQTGLASAHSGWWWVTVIHEEKNQITAFIPNPVSYSVMDFFLLFLFLKKERKHICWVNISNNVCFMFVYFHRSKKPRSWARNTTVSLCDSLIRVLIQTNNQKKKKRKRKERKRLFYSLERFLLLIAI